MEKGRMEPIYLQIRPITFLVYTDPLSPDHNHHTFPPSASCTTNNWGQICERHDHGFYRM